MDGAHTSSGMSLETRTSLMTLDKARQAGFKMEPTKMTLTNASGQGHKSGRDGAGLCSGATRQEEKDQDARERKSHHQSFAELITHARFKGPTGNLPHGAPGTLGGDSISQSQG
jgi:hypothetical protein